MMKPRKKLTKTVTPPAVRHWEWVYLFVFLGPNTVFVLSGVFDPRIVSRVSQWYNGIPYVTGLLGWSGLCFIVMKWRQKLLARRVIESDRQVCLRCTYDLRGLPNEHDCPECGSAFELELVRSAWLRWPPVGLRLDDPDSKRKRLTGYLIVAAMILIGYGLLGLSTYQSLKQ